MLDLALDIWWPAIGGAQHGTPLSQAIARLKAVSGLEALYLPYIPGQTPNFVGTGFASAWPDSSGKGRDLLQASGAAQPTINADGSLTTDGVTMFMKTGAFSFVQPETFFISAKFLSQVASNNYLLDGNTLNSMNIYRTVSGNLGVGILNGPTASLNAFHDLYAQCNGASSVSGVDGTEVAGNAGALNGGAITLGAGATGISNFANAKFAGMAALSLVPSAPVKAQIVADMATLRAAAGIT